MSIKIPLKHTSAKAFSVGLKPVYHAVIWHILKSSYFSTKLNDQLALTWKRTATCRKQCTCIAFPLCSQDLQPSNKPVLFLIFFPLAKHMAINLQHRRVRRKPETMRRHFYKFDDATAPRYSLKPSLSLIGSTECQINVCCYPSALGRGNLIFKIPK